MVIGGIVIQLQRYKIFLKYASISPTYCYTKMELLTEIFDVRDDGRDSVRDNGRDKVLVGFVSR